MPDIALCKNKQCQLRKLCYRYRAKPSLFQTYAKFEPDGKPHCKAFEFIKGWNPKDLQDLQELEEE